MKVTSLCSCWTSCHSDHTLALNFTPLGLCGCLSLRLSSPWLKCCSILTRWGVSNCATVRGKVIQHHLAIDSVLKCKFVNLFFIWRWWCLFQSSFCTDVFIKWKESVEIWLVVEVWREETAHGLTVLLLVVKLLRLVCCVTQFVCDGVCLGNVEETGSGFKNRKSSSSLASWLPTDSAVCVWVCFTFIPCSRLSALSFSMHSLPPTPPVWCHTAGLQ